MYRKTAESMLDFISASPTAFHAVENIKNILKFSGFEELQESRPWNIELNRAYFVCRNGSSIIAFRTGSSASNTGFNIIASHTDSPTFKLKEKAELRTGAEYTRLNVEGYGGMISSSWLDRPLSIAGRVIISIPGGGIESRLICFDRDLVLIPNVAIHMNRKANEGYKWNTQIDMLPLFSSGYEQGALTDMIARELGIKPDSIIGSDLYLYSREHSSVWGKNGEFVSSGRLDDLQCVYSSLVAMMASENPNTINVMACFDNEEVGSGTKQGADSTFLYDTLKRISLGLGMSESEYLQALASGFMLSADNAHAVHPNHPEFTDVENHVFMNKGVVLKSHAGQKYTSDGMSTAIVRAIADKAFIPLQYFSNRSDMAGGSTLGNISMSHVSIKSADIGLAQLAMHSCYETAGAKDTEYMIKFMKEFYSVRFQEFGDGMIRII